METKATTTARPPVRFALARFGDVEVIVGPELLDELLRRRAQPLTEPAEPGVDQ